MRYQGPMSDAPLQEYRIKDGKVESRILDFTHERKSGWTEVSPAQLSSHVKRNTVVARWLEKKLGWRPLLRACTGLTPTTIVERERVSMADITLAGEHR